MRIVVISNLYSPYIRGGNEIIAHTIVEGLRQNMHHVSIITTRPYEGLASLGVQKTAEQQGTMYRFWPLNIYSLLYDYRHSVIARFIWHILDIFNIHSRLSISQILHSEKPDIVITNNLTGLGFLIPRLLRRRGIRHFHIVHDVQLFTPSGLLIYGQEKSLREKIVSLSGYQSLMRWLWGSPEIVFSPSQFLSGFYRSRGYFAQSRFVTLPNPIPFIESLPPKAKVSGPLKLIFVGQITEAKGILALADLIQRHAEWDLSLKVVGLGPDIRRLAHQLRDQERVQLLGWRSRTEVLQLLSESDVLVHPSLCYENFPTSILEALAVGVPVLATASGGAAELLQAGKNGWHVAPGDWEAMERTLQSLVDNPESARELSDYCQQSVSQLTRKKYLEQLGSYFESV